MPRSGADENSARREHDNADVTSCDALGCAIVLVHHSNKAGTDHRGSSSLKGAMDSMLPCAEDGEIASILSCEKIKDGEAWQAQRFELAQDGDAAEGVHVKWTGAAKVAGKAETHAARCVAFLRCERRRVLRQTISRERSDCRQTTPKTSWRTCVARHGRNRAERRRRQTRRAIPV